MKRKIALPKVKVFGKNKNELYISVLIIAGLVLWVPNLELSLTPDMSRYSLRAALITATWLFIALFCVINALSDFKRMGEWEKPLSVLWFCILLFVTLVFVYAVVQP